MRTKHGATVNTLGQWELTWCMTKGSTQVCRIIHVQMNMWFKINSNREKPNFNVWRAKNVIQVAAW